MIEVIGINIILANVVSIIEAVTSFWKHATINRRKQLVLLISQCLLCSVSYLLLHTYTSLATNLFAILKYLYMLKFHKEEKVILGPIENIILNIPYFLFAIIFFNNDGWLGFFYAITGALDDSRFSLKKDSSKQILSVFTQFCYAVYHFAIFDFVKGTKQVVNMVINGVNYFRIKKNGESAYYSNKMGDLKDDG